MKNLLLLALLSAGLYANCELSDWKFTQYSDEFIVIDGSTTCSQGQLIIKAYDTEDQPIGNKIAYIDAGTFKTYLSGNAPENMKIKYAIVTQ